MKMMQELQKWNQIKTISIYLLNASRNTIYLISLKLTMLFHPWFQCSHPEILGLGSFCIGHVCTGAAGRANGKRGGCRNGDTGGNGYFIQDGKYKEKAARKPLFLKFLPANFANSDSDHKSYGLIRAT